MKQYDGRTVVIIGGTSGVSYATARYLLDRGARVLVTGRTKASIDAVREDLGLDVIAIESDATSMADIDPLPTG